MEVLKEKDINEYNVKARRIFNFLSIAGEYRVIGSASLKKIKYFSDYDLDELFKDTKTPFESLDTKIYKSFKEKFIKARKDPNIFITDFKCGLDSNSEPLRWSYDDMMKGYKTLENGDKMSFEKCLNIKTTIKLDVVAIIDGIFTEFSENYFFKFEGQKGNFFPHDIEKDHILNELKHSYDEYMYVEKNYMKALKRCFAYKELKNKRRYKSELEKMINFFNSPIGLLNKMRSELDIILVLLENKHGFRKVKKTDVLFNLNHIKQRINEKGYTMFDDDFKELNMKNEDDMQKSIKELRDEIFDYINKSTFRFINENKNLILY